MIDFSFQPKSRKFPLHTRGLLAMAKGHQATVRPETIITSQGPKGTCSFSRSPNSPILSLTRKIHKEAKAVEKRLWGEGPSERGQVQVTQWSFGLYLVHPSLGQNYGSRMGERAFWWPMHESLLSWD